jgi:hypothetical protein
VGLHKGAFPPAQAYNAHWLAGMLAGAQGAQALSGGWDSSGEARADDEALVAEAEVGAGSGRAGRGGGCQGAAVIGAACEAAIAQCDTCLAGCFACPRHAC